MRCAAASASYDKGCLAGTRRLALLAGAWSWLNSWAILTGKGSSPGVYKLLIWDLGDGVTAFEHILVATKVAITSTVQRLGTTVKASRAVFLDRPINLAIHTGSVFVNCMHNAPCAAVCSQRRTLGTL